MFTGLIETMGTVREAAGEAPRRLVITSDLPAKQIPLGASVAIDGCCLTVVDRGSDWLAFEAATETLARTTIGGLVAGARVNLEQAMQVGERLGGHVVLGHVDGVGRLEVREQRGSSWYLGIRAPADVAPLVAPRGSVTVAGISLTVTSVERDLFYIGIIPHTWVVTNLSLLPVGGGVNLEADVLARYVARLVEAREQGFTAGAG